MKAALALLFALLCLAPAPASARSAASVVLGDSAQDCDCPPTPSATPTFTPTASPTPSPTPTATEVNPLKLEIEGLGFPVQWEGDVLLVTLADEQTRFDTSKADLRPQSVLRLRTLAGVLKRYPGNKIRVDGHTDGNGKPDFNRRLSLRRAKAVSGTLISQGVPAADFEAVEGHGPDLPVGDNASDEGRAMNRRVELRLRFHALQGASDGAAWVSPTPTPLPTQAPTETPTPVPQP